MRKEERRGGGEGRKGEVHPSPLASKMVRKEGKRWMEVKGAGLREGEGRGEEGDTMR